MELKGEFKSVSEVLDLIQIVCIGKKSGEVSFKGEGGTVITYFSSGKAVGFDSTIPEISTLKSFVRSERLSLKEALKSILHYLSTWEEGRFLFVEKPSAGEGLGEVDMVNVMMEFSKERDETPEEVREAFKKNLGFKVKEEIEEEVCLDSIGWKILFAFLKGKGLKDVLFSVPYPYKDKLDRFLALRKKGVLEEGKVELAVVKEEEEPANSLRNEVSEEKIEKVRELLTTTMGPIGDVLVEETFEDLGIKRLSQDMVNVFVEKLLDKIPETCLVEGESCRKRFKVEFEKILKGG